MLNATSRLRRTIRTGQKMSAESYSRFERMTILDGLVDWSICSLNEFISKQLYLEYHLRTCIR